MVLRAYDPKFDRDVAIKVLHRKFSHNPKIRKRFLLEARTIAALDHPAIVPVFDAGQDDEFTYLVMRLMEGGTLHERIEKGALSLEEIRPIVDRVTAALDAAHDQGIIHRDVKPENILFDRYGAAYLSDFGIVKIQDSDARLTQNQFIGTPAYMSPEQFSSRSVLDGRSDLYSLGAVLFEMITGELPYKGNTSVQLAMKHASAAVPRLHEHNPSLPIEAQTIISTAMAKSPDDRYPTGQALAAALDMMIEPPEEPVIAAPMPAPAQDDGSSNRIIYAVIGVVLVALLGWLAFSNLGSSDSGGDDGIAAAQAVRETSQARETEIAVESNVRATENAASLSGTITAVYEEAVAQGGAQIDELETAVANTLTAQAPTATSTLVPPTETPVEEAKEATIDAATTEADTEEDIATATSDSSTTGNGAPTLIIRSSSVNMRKGPGQTYDIVQVAFADDEFDIIGRNPSNSWYEVQLDPSTTGWVSQTTVDLVNVDNNAIPIGDIPSRPTDTPNPPTNTPIPAQPTNTPNWAATNAVLTQNAPTSTLIPTNTPNYAQTSAAMTAAAPTATTAATAIPTATSAPTATPVPTDAPVPTSSGPLSFNYFFQSCSYDGGDYVCNLAISPSGGSGVYQIEIFDADPPSTYTGVTGQLIHSTRGGRCSPWIHQIQITDETTGGVFSQDVFWDPNSQAIFPDGACAAQ